MGYWIGLATRSLYQQVHHAVVLSTTVLKFSFFALQYVTLIFFTIITRLGLYACRLVYPNIGRDRQMQSERIYRMRAEYYEKIRKADALRKDCDQRCNDD